MWCTVDIVETIKPKFVIWENVKNLLSKKHIHNFNNYLEIMNQLGYNSYYQVLNAKDFSIPQNRERVYTISIRKDVDTGSFRFPDKQELKLRLKDILEDKVDEKYYLSQYKIDKIAHWNAYQKPFEKVQGNNSICPTLTARGAGEEHSGMITYCNELENTTSLQEKCLNMLNSTDKVINVGEVTPNSQAGQIYSDEGLSPTLMAGTHGYAMGNIMQHNKDTDAQCIRVGGMFDTKDSKHQAGSIYNKDGLAPSLDSMQGGYRQPMVTIDNEPQIMKYDIAQQVVVRKYPVDIENLKKCLRDAKKKSNLSNTEIATLLEEPQTKVEHWFRTDNCFSIPEPTIWLRFKNLLNILTSEFDESIMTFEEKDSVYDKTNRVYDSKGIAPTITTQEEKIIDNPLKGKSNYGWHFEQNVYGENSQCCRSVKASNGSGNIPKILTIGNYSPSNHDASRIVDENGLAPTVKENHGTVTAVAQQELETPCIIASRGRNSNEENTKTEQKLELNSKGLCNTITSVQKDNYVLEKYKKFAKENGYIPEMFNPYNNSEIEDIAPTQSAQCGSTTSSATVLIKEPNNSIVAGQIQPIDRNYNKHASKREEQFEPRNDNLANALLTQANKNMVAENKILYEEPLERKGWHRKACEVLNTNGISTCIHTQSNNLLQKVKVEDERFAKQALETFQENNCNNGDTIDAFNKKLNTSGVSPTITTRPEGFKTAILPIQNYRIRKLTPRECWRLMRLHR